LEAKKRKDADSSSRIWIATNFFDPILYKQKVRVVPEKSTCLANQTSRVIMPETETTHKPSFDLLLASTQAPDINWLIVTSNLILNSRKLCHYVVEDLMISVPDAYECLLLFISTKHLVLQVC
jgi:hypothetical protein